MAAGDKYLTAARRNLNKEQLFRLLCREDANGKPFLNIGGNFPAPEELGTIIDSDNISQAVFNSNSWTDEGGIITSTFNPNSIRLQSGTNGYENLIRYNLWYTQLEEFKVRCTVVMNDVSANSVYFGLGLAGVSTFSAKMSVRAAMWANGGAENGLMYLYYGNGNNQSTLVANGGYGARLAFVQGDSIEMELVQSGLTITYTARNLTTPAGDLSISWTNTNALVYPGSVSTQLLNIEQLALWNFKGDYTVTSLHYISTESKNIDLAIYGNSKGEGYYCNTLANRISKLLAVQSGKIVQVSAGSGNVTQDLINALPELILINPRKVVLLGIPRNDLTNFVLDAVWQANDVLITNTLLNAAIDVYHFMPSPETALDQSNINTFYTSTYPANKILQSNPLFNTAVDCSADGIHYSETGAQLEADMILPIL